LKDKLTESYCRRPRFIGTPKALVQDIMFSITTRERLWANPIIECQKLSIVKKSETNKIFNEEYTFPSSLKIQELYNKKIDVSEKSKQDFIYCLIK
jgi:hypothetical protein